MTFGAHGTRVFHIVIKFVEPQVPSRYEVFAGHAILLAITCGGWSVVLVCKYQDPKVNHGAHACRALSRGGICPWLLCER